MARWYWRGLIYVKLRYYDLGGEVCASAVTIVSLAVRNVSLFKHITAVLRAA